MKRVAPLCASLTVCLLLGLVLGCGGGGGGLPAFVSLALAYYWVTESGVLPIAATVGDEVQLLASGKTGVGQEYSLTTRVTWNSSDPSVATVSASGLLRAVAPGTTQITATYGRLTSPPLTVSVVAAGATPTAIYYPFAVGNQWVYTGTAVSPTGARPAQQATLTVTSQRQVVLEGLVWWELQIQGTDPHEPPAAMYLRHDDMGLREIYYLREGAHDVPHYNYRLREPLLAGAHWTDPFRPEHYWDILATDATVTVPAGTYTACLQVREHDVDITAQPFDTTAWFAPGVGIVRALTTVPNPSGGDPIVESEQRLLRVQFPTS